MEALRELEEQLRTATGEEVFFESNPDSTNRSKFYVRREGEWTKPEQQKEIYHWLDNKYRGILKVIQPRLHQI